MKIVVQRTTSAKVIVSNETISEIDNGLVLFICFEKNDTKLVIGKSVEKILNLRIFNDENGKMNKSIKDMNYPILCISQFTLSWDGKKGNRPSFDNSMNPQSANDYFELFCGELDKINPIKKGVFGEHMQVQLINDGPVTFQLSF